MPASTDTVIIYERDTTKERFPKFLSGDDVEELAIKLADGNAEFDITVLKRARLFAEARLLGVLALRKQQGKPIIFRINSKLPDFTLTNHHWKFFVRSAAGFVITQYATSIFDSSSRDWACEIRKQQAIELEQNNGFMGSGKEVTAPAIERFRAPLSSRLLDGVDVECFAATFRRLLEERIVSPADNRPSIHDIIDFAYETVRNTIEHGQHDDIGHPIDSAVRFLSIRRLNLPHETLGDLIESSTGPVCNYLIALQRYLSSRYPKPREMVEITVADSGIGIPARMAHSKSSIYDGPIAAERDLLLKALTPEGTSKPRSIANAGLGLVKAMRATRYLDGLIVFRTGRLLMYKHFLGEDAREESPQLYDWEENTQHQLVAGTSVSLLFPWMAPQQYTLDSKVNGGIHAD